MDKPPLFAAPVKHSVTIAGHQTSISLEPIFWDALRRAAQQEDMPLNALIARIDDLRHAATRRSASAPATDHDDGTGNGRHLTSNPAHMPASNLASNVAPNLAGAIRCWLWNYYCE